MQTRACWRVLKEERGSLSIKFYFLVSIQEETGATYCTYACCVAIARLKRSFVALPMAWRDVFELYTANSGGFLWSWDFEARLQSICLQSRGCGMACAVMGKFKTSVGGVFTYVHVDRHIFISPRFCFIYSFFSTFLLFPPSEYPAQAEMPNSDLGSLAETSQKDL